MTMWIQKRPGMLFIALLAGILTFGLIPHRFTNKNQAGWSAEKGGLFFGGQGIAYSESPFALFPGEQSTKGFTLEVALQSSPSQDSGLRCILTLFSPSSPEFSIALAQWQSELIILPGDPSTSLNSPVSPPLEIPRIIPQGVRVLLTLVSDLSSGTFIYVNGHLVRYFPSMTFKTSQNRDPFSLILGNSPDGNHPWTGTIYGLTIHEYPVSTEWVAENAGVWKPAEGLKVFYRFEENVGRVAANRVGPQGALIIPERFIPLQRTILASPQADLEWTFSYWGDVFINLAGFIPFGALLFVFLASRFSGNRKRNLLVVVLSGLILSLGIELLQVWIPGRSSSLSDVMANFLGSLIGAVWAGKS